MVKIFTTLFSFLLILKAFSLHAQRIDAGFEKILKLSLHNETSGSKRIDLMDKLGLYYTERYLLTLKNDEPEKGVETLKRALQLSKEISYTEGKFESIRLMGIAYLYLKDTVRARRCITASLNYLKSKRKYAEMVSSCISHGRAAYSADFSLLSKQYFNQALSIAVDNHVKEKILLCKSWVMFGEAINGKDILQDALKVASQYRNSGENLERIYYQLAQIYRYNGNLKTALGYALSSVREMERHNDTAYYSHAYAELALNYDVLGQSERSLYYYRKTLKARANLPLREEYKYRTLGFIVKNLIKLKRPKEALKEVMQYETAYPPVSDFGKAYCDQNKAYCYEALGDYNKAERYYLRMLKSPEMNNPTEISCLAYYDISNFYILKKDFKKAEYYIIKGNCMTSAFDNVKNYEHIRFRIDSALGNFKSAMQHYTTYQRVKDSIFNEATVKEISELQLKYESSKKEKDIALLRKDSQIQRDRLREAGNIRNLTFGGICLLLLALMILYGVLINNRKKSKLIDQKNLTLHHLLNEKEWLIKEIHHRVKNNLQIVIGLLQRQSSYIDNDIAVKAIQNSENRMHAIALIHQKLYQVDTLNQINMHEYIDDLILHLRETADTDVNITFIKQLEDTYLDVSQAVPLGLILNEAITNAIKYAYPGSSEGKIYVQLSRLTDNDILLQVKDDGTGLGAEFDLKSANSMGINLMRGLSKQLGGEFNFNTEKGVGITVRFRCETFVKANY